MTDPANKPPYKKIIFVLIGAFAFGCCWRNTTLHLCDLIPLVIQGDTPYQLCSFSDYAVDRNLLSKGWWRLSLIHRLLLEYFAENGWEGEWVRRIVTLGRRIPQIAMVATDRPCTPCDTPTSVSALQICKRKSADFLLSACKYSLFLCFSQAEQTGGNSLMNLDSTITDQIYKLCNRLFGKSQIAPLLFSE